MHTGHYILAICFDSGDTIIDEGTEVKPDGDVAICAELIPGAGEMVRRAKERGYKVALVADGPRQTFYNCLTQHGLYDLFDAFAISQLVGASKPDARMFRQALDALGIAEADYGRTIMVGNNLQRDVKGANALGMISVWLNWSPRRSKVPADDLEVPRYTIKMPLDLLQVIDEIEALHRDNPPDIRLPKSSETSEV